MRPARARRPNDLMEYFKDAFRGVPPAGGSRGLRHGAQPVGIQFLDRLDERWSAELGVTDTYRGAGVDHRSGIFLLVPATKGAWDEDHRQPHRGGLSDGSHPRPAHDQVRARHQIRHVISESHSSVARTSVQFYACGALLSGDVNHLLEQLAEVVESGPNRLVEISSPLASA